MADGLLAELNAALHPPGVEPCGNACTHVIADDWTALGMANVVGRRLAGFRLVALCRTCDGSGVVPEDHGQGMTEWLGCPDCRGGEDELAGLFAELDQLRRWKVEATEVLALWDGVAEELGRPGRLGDVMPVAARAEVKRLRADLARRPGTPIDPDAITTDQLHLRPMTNEQRAATVMQLSAAVRRDDDRIETVTVAHLGHTSVDEDGLYERSVPSGVREITIRFAAEPFPSRT